MYCNTTDKKLVLEPVQQIEYNFINNHLSDYILQASDSSGVDPYLIDAVITVESGGKIYAVSPTKVRGPMQVTKKTATIYGLNPYDIYENILAGSLYLRDMINEFNDTNLALVAYNNGPTYVRNNLDLISFRYSEKVNKVYETNKEL